MFEIFPFIETSFKSESTRDKTVGRKKPHPSFSQLARLETSQLYLITIFPPIVIILKAAWPRLLLFM